MPYMTGRCKSPSPTVATRNARKFLPEKKWSSNIAKMNAHHDSIQLKQYSVGFLAWRFDQEIGKNRTIFTVGLTSESLCQNGIPRGDHHLARKRRDVDVL